MPVAAARPATELVIALTDRGRTGGLRGCPSLKVAFVLCVATAPRLDLVKQVIDEGTDGRYAFAAPFYVGPNLLTDPGLSSYV
jgi:hypothetical protein